MHHGIAASAERSGTDERWPNLAIVKRVLVVTGAFPVVSETFVVDHVEGLRRHGWEVVVASGAVDAEMLRAIEAAGHAQVRTEPITLPRPKTAQFFAEAFASCSAALLYSPRAAISDRAMLPRVAALAELYRRLRPDLVHAHFAGNGICAALASRGRVPVVVDFHGHDFTVLPRTVGWGVMRDALRDCALVAHSQFAIERIEKGLGRRPTMVQLGVDPGLFRAAPRGTEWPEPIRWLVVGRLEEKKGQDVAIRALALARRDPRHRAPELTISGGGSRRLALEALAKDLGVEAHVRFTGPLSHGGVAARMADADVLLVPSVPTPDGGVEAFGRVAIEGLACGLPVVVSELGGLPEAVGEAGWKAPPGDPEGLVESIAAVIERGTPEVYRMRSLARAGTLSNERMWAEYAQASHIACGESVRDA